MVTNFETGLSKTLIFGEIFNRLSLNYFVSFLEEEMEKLTLLTSAVKKFCVY
jgi:hypothetical protein